MGFDDGGGEAVMKLGLLGDGGEAVRGLGLDLGLVKSDGGEKSIDDVLLIVEFG